MEPSGEHSSSEHGYERGEIRDPERIELVELPEAKERQRRENEKLIIEPEGLMSDDVSVVVGARSDDPEKMKWTNQEFFRLADIDPEKVVRIQQKHTSNVREVDMVSAGAGIFDKEDEDTRVRSTEDKSLDGVWTKDRDLTLIIGTADCAAVVIGGKDGDGKPIAGIAHAGIAGAQQDVVGNLVREMKEKGKADPESLKVYVNPNICERCYDVLSETSSDEKVEKAMAPETKIITDEDGERREMRLSRITDSFKDFKERYGAAFNQGFGRELHQNDVFYVTKGRSGELELHYNINMMIYLSLVGNGVRSENIGFSKLCSFGDSLPSHRRTGETSGIYSTISIKE